IAPVVSKQLVVVHKAMEVEEANISLVMAFNQIFFKSQPVRDSCQVIVKGHSCQFFILVLNYAVSGFQLSQAAFEFFEKMAYKENEISKQNKAH
ncbi:hypothetical protein ADUPG1_004731, partial [Aduncisulcus paluster]